MRKIQSSSNRVFALLTLVLFFSQLTIVPAAYAQEEKPDLPEYKQTTLELYVTSAEAYDMWKADPKKVMILDVRTPEEYIFTGHAPMAWNISAFDQSYEWDSEKKRFPMKPNADFIAKVKEIFQPDDILLITCRSGGRSALAVNELAKIGYKNAYTITDGFEGDKVNNDQSVYNGLRMVNGWKNSGLPYTYKIDPKLMLIPSEK